MSNDTAQLLFFGAAGCVAALVLWYIFVKAPQARAAELAPWAAKRNLRFTPPRSLGSHTTGQEVSVLDGAVQGVPFQLRSARLVNSRRAGISGQTDIQCRASVPVQARFTVTCGPGPSVQAPDAVWTGDSMFDGRVRTKSDNGAAARAFLDPALRSLLPFVVSDGSVTIHYAGGEIAIRLDNPIWEEAQLDRALGLVVAAAQARLG